MSCPGENSMHTKGSVTSKRKRVSVKGTATEPAEVTPEEKKGFDRNHYKWV